jgi:DNA-binding CsgD family transcriptional regulator
MEERMDGNVKGRSKRTPGETIATLLKTRDELNIRNIRLRNLTALVIMPLAVIIGDLRLQWIDYDLLGVDSGTMMLMSFGLGMLLLALLPQKLLPHMIRIGAVCCMLLLILQIIFVKTENLGMLTTLFCLYQAAAAFCMAGGYFVFFFRLRNVERLAAVIFCEIYFIVIEDFLWNVKAIAHFLNNAGSIAFVALFCVVVFFGNKENFTPIPERNPKEGRGDYSVYILDVTYLVLGYMYTYLSFENDILPDNVYVYGSIAAVVLVVVIQLVFNNSVYHMWNTYIMLVIISMAALLVDSSFFVNAASLLYGVADGVGYISVMYLLGGAARHNNSYRFFRGALLVFFLEHDVFIFGIDSIFAHLDVSVILIVFTIALVFVIIGFMTIPLLAKNLFMTDWSDSYHGIDMTVYAQEVEQVEEIDKLEGLNMTPREREIFILLMSGMLMKQISAELCISNSTVNFHTKNLYRKLNVQGRSELSAKYHELM